MKQDKSPLESKKFIALAVGTTLTTLFTIAALITIIAVPAVSSAVVSIITVSLASLNSVIGLYAIGQSAVDWRLSSSARSTQTNSIDIQDIEVEYE
jgi:hypothetical protein